ncbi:glycosyltransferase family 2 protein [Pelagicoccus sp. SDUM812005]|uniref:glycosyltransferase family 2 protein n=1 Tax=Pelagicoccus sp. SDUM812005 TaxID=3041257 RepID=UPI00280C8EBD|nr:glycosyltransferase family 2 protein [Pelagicoccus sp. SDUM812005]MDQ8183711.1 glycosyltransferase family 2 protein [Pelagicoccus sp. SDUM812005]
MLLSIIINNYNYGRYLDDCLSSATAYRSESVEVIVVDDGSKDNSRSVIEAWRDRVNSVFKENGGQMSAYAEGFERARGEWCIFLDADDRIYCEELFKLLARGVGDKVVKLQYPLRVIDGKGNPTGRVVPRGAMRSVDFKVMINEYGEYISPPGSGAVYRRSYLEEVLPYFSREFEERTAADAPLYVSAPMFGEVWSTPLVCGEYRSHCSGDSRMSFESDLSPAVWKHYWYLKRLVSARNRVVSKMFKARGEPSRIGRSRMVSDLKRLVAVCAVREGWYRKRVLWASCGRVMQNPSYAANFKILAMGWFVAVTYLEHFGVRRKLLEGVL